MTVANYELLVDFNNDGFKADTVEAGSPARVAGQFANFNSCAVRVTATADRVRLTVGTQITATVGAAVLCFDPDNANGDAGQPASGVVWSWYTDANNYIECIYNKASARFELSRYAAGAGTTLNLAATFTDGLACALYIAWDAATLYMAFNGGAVSSAADARAPTLPTTVDIGSRAAASQMEAAYGAVALFSAKLTTEQWEYFAALRATRPPLFGEFVGRTMTALWVGEESEYYDSMLDLVTSELWEAECFRGRSYASQLTGRSEAGNLTAVLNNSDGRYSSFNTAGALYGYIIPGRKVRLRAADASKHYTMWSGYLDNVVPSPGMPATARLTAKGPLIRLSSNRVNVAGSSGALTGTIIGAILDAAGVVAADQVLDTGQTTTGRWFAENRGALEAAREIEETELGFIRESRDFDIVYEDRHARLTDANSIASQATYSDAVGAARPYLDIQQSAPMKEVFNAIRVEVQKFSVGGLAVLWTLSGETPTVEAGASLTIVAKYPTDATGGDAGAYVDAWTTPVVGTDITQTGVANGDLAVAVVKTSNQMEITVTNNHASATASLTLVQARGTPVTTLNPATVSHQDGTSITAYGRNSHQLPAKWLASALVARDYTRYVVSRYKDDHPVLSMRLNGNEDATMLADVLTREISDRVSIVATGFKTQLGIDEDFFVESIQYQVNSQRVLTAAIGLSSVAGDGGYWAVGVSELGVTTKVGY